MSSPPPSSMSNLSPSVIIFIFMLVFSITIFIIACLCLLLRLLNRRNSTTATATVSPETPNPSSLTTTTSHLPLFTFSSVTPRSSSAASDCAVCLSKFDPHHQLRLLPLCCHAFHAHCIDTWLQFNDTCPLCRSVVQVSESDVVKAFLASSATAGDSFRVEIESLSRRLEPLQDFDPAEARRTTYSNGSFDYVIEEESENSFGPGHRRGGSETKDEVFGAPVAQPLHETSLGSRSWVKEYVDRLHISLSSNAMSFGGSGRVFSGSNRQNDVSGAGESEVEAYRVGEEISELFRWVSGV